MAQHRCARAIYIVAAFADDWETQRALNPRDAAGDRDGDGYISVEEYLHSFFHDTSAP